MGAYSLATRYAKSLISLAQEKGQLEEAFENVKTIDAMITNNSDLKLLFKSPIIPTDKKLIVAQKLFEANSTEVIYKFMVLVIKKGRESYLNEIFDAFITQYNLIKGITPVELTTAIKLDATQVQGIINALKNKDGLSGVELNEKVDEALVGGFVLKYGDNMIDSSVQRNLRELRTLVEDDTYIKKYS